MGGKLNTLALHRIPSDAQSQPEPAIPGREPSSRVNGIKNPLQIRFSYSTALIFQPQMPVVPVPPSFSRTMPPSGECRMALRRMFFSACANVLRLPRTQHDGGTEHCNFKLGQPSS